jgi:hypothetical protein
MVPQKSRTLTSMLRGTAIQTMKNWRKLPTSNVGYRTLQCEVDDFVRSRTSPEESETRVQPGRQARKEPARERKEARDMEGKSIGSFIIRVQMVLLVRSSFFQTLHTVISKHTNTPSLKHTRK